MVKTISLPPPGTVVGWIENGQPSFGRLLSERRGKWVIETTHGKSTDLRGKDIAVIGPVGNPREIEILAHEKAKEWDVELLWTILSESGLEEIAPYDAVHIYTNDDDPLLPCVAWIALWNHPEYFARSGRTSFRIRSQKEREKEAERLREKKREEDLIHLLEKEGDQIKQDKISLDVWVFRHKEFQVLLEEEFLGGAPSGKLPRLRERFRHLLEDLYSASRMRWPIFYFLGTRLGFLDPWAESHPRIRRHLHRIANWEPPPPPNPVSFIEPVNELISVDDATTRDRDDAFAFSLLSPEELVVDVAIADLSEGVALHEEYLDQLCDLGTSVYLPTRTFHLLPEEWGVGRHSLDAGTKRPLFLVRLRLRTDGTISAPPQILKGWGVISHQFSYEEFDRILEESEEFQVLYRTAMAFKKRRYERGADIIDHPEATVIVQNGQPVDLKVIPAGVGARGLIRELMILANMSFALFAKERKLLIPYRVQDGNGGDRSPTLVRFNPSPHRGLAVEAYTYATSPMRRTQDILVQRALSSEFGGQPLPPEKLLEFAERSEESYQEMRRWMKLAELYWKLRYLEQFPETSLRGTVLERSGNRVWVRVSPLEIILNLSPPPHPLADSHPLRIVTLDSERGLLELEWEG